MKRKISFVCFVTLLSLNVLGISSLLSKQTTINTVRNNINRLICAGEKVEAPPVNIHSIGPKNI